MKQCLRKKCGKDFEPTKPKQMYCSNKCRTYAFREKQKDVVVVTKTDKKKPPKKEAEEMSEELVNKIIAIQTQPKPSFIDIKNFKAYKEKQIEELNKQYKNL